VGPLDPVASFTIESIENGNRIVVPMRMEQAVARAVSGATDARDAYARALKAIAEGLDWPCGAAWEPELGDPDLLRCVASWAADEEGPRGFEKITRATSLRTGEGLPGRVWQTGRAAWVDDAANDTRMPRRAAAAAAGMHSAVCFPVRSERGVVGVVEVFGPSAREPDADLVAALEVVGVQIGQVVERRRAEDSQRASEQRYRATVEAALDCVVTMDHRGRVVEFNPAAERTFGYSSEAAVGREMAELIVPPDLRDEHRRGLARLLAGGTPHVLDRRFEIEAMRSDGSLFPVELAITRIDVPGAPVFTGYLRDITERRWAEAELRASRARIVEAADAARRRIERDLHDGAQQQLVSVAINLNAARACIDEDPVAARELLDEAVGDLSRGMDELRELARGIHPAVLIEGGLEPALRGLVRRSAVPARLLAVPPDRLAEPIEAAAYFVVSEGLTNVARHGTAATLVEIEVTRRDGRLVVEIRDDAGGGADPGGGGLRGLADRLAALDGSLDVRSPHGGGTTLRAEIPCG
jgi:PAS domain S-box-containing protein